MLDLRAIAGALGGDVVGGQVLCPGPGHGLKDRSLSVRLSASAPDGFLAFSFANDDWRVCRDHVAARLGVARRQPGRRNGFARSPLAQQGHDPRALWLWQRRRPIQETVAERYLREARGYAGEIPATVGFLPGRGIHPASLIAAFAVASEREPALLAIQDTEVRGVHITRLLPDGSGRTGKMTIGCGSSGNPIVLAPPNDLLGLAVTEGIEDGLSIHAATGLGVWAAGTAGRMPPLAANIPTYVETVSIFGHDDTAGRRGAIKLAIALRARGCEVLLKFLRAEPR
jgi:hypothetical protein